MKNKKGKSKVFFDQEIITRELAKKIVSEVKNEPQIRRSQFDSVEKNVKERKKKRNVAAVMDKKQSNKTPEKANGTEQPCQLLASEKKSEDVDVTQMESSPGEKKESNRALKRKKHAKLLEAKKIKLEVELQQKSLNYLSKWKHTRSEWKFEKLKQIWLQQSLFDDSKIPDEFWSIVVEYFRGAKGHSRQIVLDQAIKLIEDNSSDENVDKDYETKLKRARDIVQNLE